MKPFLTHYFKKQIKKLENKLPHIRDDLFEKLNSLVPTNEIHIGKSIYKIRIKSRDLNKGKSGGLRSYIYLYRKKDLLIPLCLYLKSTQESLQQKELEIHFQRTIEEVFTIITGYSQRVISHPSELEI